MSSLIFFHELSHLAVTDSLANMNTMSPMAVESRSTRPRHVDPPAAVLTGGGTGGNERLTAATGTVLIVLLAVIGVTILQMHTLLWVHLFVGVLLIGPLALKLASTGYRFARYYAGDGAYRLKGPPSAPLRMLAPAVVLSTLVVFASGVWLLFAGPSSRSTLLPIHKIGFFAWLALTSLHVLGHLTEMPPALRADYGRPASLSPAGLNGDIGGRAGRMIVLAGAVVGGLVIAVLVIPEFAAWMHWNSTFHGHHGGH